MNLPQWVKAIVVMVVTSVAAAVCTPWSLKLVPDAPGSPNYHLPTTWQDIAQPIALALIALAAGWWGLHVVLAGWAVTMPAALVLGVYGEYFMDGIGANLWPVSVIVLAPIVFGAAVGLASLGRLLRQRDARRQSVRVAA